MLKLGIEKIGEFAVSSCRPAEHHKRAQDRHLSTEHPSAASVGSDKLPLRYSSLRVELNPPASKRKKAKRIVAMTGTSDILSGTHGFGINQLA